MKIFLLDELIRTTWIVQGIISIVCIVGWYIMQQFVRMIVARVKKIEDDRKEAAAAFNLRFEKNEALIDKNSTAIADNTTEMAKINLDLVKDIGKCLVALEGLKGMLNK